MTDDPAAAEAAAEAGAATDTILDARHLSELAASGLTSETIVAAGIHSVDGEQIATILGWRPRQFQWGRGMAFPYPDPWAAASEAAVDGDGDGGGNGGGALPQPLYERIKPDYPREHNNKPVKYESPRGSRNRAYIQFPFVNLAAPADSPGASPPTIIITEGEKKTLALLQAGFLAIGLVGVWGWQVPRERSARGRGTGHREMIPDLARISWQGRPVVILFDSDAADSKHIQGAEGALVRALKSAGAIPRVARLPTDPDQPGHKVGVDDFLISHGEHGPEALQAIIDAAKTLVPGEPQPEDAPVAVADDFLRAECTHSSGWLTVAWWREQFWHWPPALRYWLPLTDQQVTGWIVNWRHLSDPEVKPRFVHDVLICLRARTMVAPNLKQPCWLPFPRFPAQVQGGSEGGGGAAGGGGRRADRSSTPPHEVIAARNAILHPASFFTGDCAAGLGIQDPTPEFFSPNVLSYPINLQAPPPVFWLEFLASIWGHDPQCIDTLQEWMGYCLIPDTRQQKILFVVGPIRAGKGTIAEVLRQLVCPENACHVTLSGLAESHGVAPLVGKAVAIISDARLSGKTDIATTVERLLSISGEDAVTVNPKFQQQFTTRLSTRFCIFTNELPRLGDASAAIASRMIVLRLTQSWIGREDHGLAARLAPELSSIMLWALAGLKRLQKRGRFVQPESGKSILEEIQELSSPILAFVRDCCRVGPHETVATADLYREYRAWCDTRGRVHPSDIGVFARDLRAVVPEIDNVRICGGSGRISSYVGISLASLLPPMSDDP